MLKEEKSCMEKGEKGMEKYGEYRMESEGKRNRQRGREEILREKKVVWRIEK